MSESQQSIHVVQSQTTETYNGLSTIYSSMTTIPTGLTSGFAEYKDSGTPDYTGLTISVATTQVNDELMFVAPGGSTLTVANDQRKANHAGPGLYCDLDTCMCGRKFDNPDARARHRQYRRNKSSGRFRCDKCGNVFGSKQNLNTHLNSHLSRKSKRYRWVQCFAGSSSSEALRKHESKCDRNRDECIAANLTSTSGI